MPDRYGQWREGVSLDRIVVAWSGRGVAINLFYLFLLIACSAYAFLRGGAPERIGISIIAANAVLTFVAVSAPPVRFQGVEVGVFVVDVVAFLAFVLLALFANRFWTIWVSALLGLGLVGHLAMLSQPQVIPWAYAVVLSIWSYPILLLVIGGTYSHQRRLKQTGADPSWTPSSAPRGRVSQQPGPTP